MCEELDDNFTCFVLDQATWRDASTFEWLQKSRVVSRAGLYGQIFN